MAQGRPRRPRRGGGDGPNQTDLEVGARIRQARGEADLSQERLAAGIGVSFQQVQKYERGTNRVSASRLWYLAKVFRVGIMYFYGKDQRILAGGATENPAEAFEPDPLRQRETIELVEAYHGITDPRQRQSFVDLARALAAPYAELGRAGRRRGRTPKSRLTGAAQGSTRAPRPTGRPRRTPN